MSRYNDGVITTNESCIGCNNCVAVCPILGANVASVNNGRVRMYVSDRKCIHCGLCMNACSHNARDFQDDTDRFLNDLSEGEMINVIVDPSFYFSYLSHEGELFGYLKTLGVKRIIDGSIGGDISIFCNAKFIHDSIEKNEDSRQFIAHTCPAITNYFSTTAPDMIKYVIPVQLPMVCAAIYLRKYLGETSKIALLTPCVAISDEIKSHSAENCIDYVVGVSSLYSRVDKEKMKECTYDEDIRGYTPGMFIAQPEIFSDEIRACFGSKRVFTSKSGALFGKGGAFESYQEMELTHHYDFMNLLSCSGGCCYGPALSSTIENFEELSSNFFKLYNKTHEEDDDNLSPAEKYEKLVEKFSFLEAEDFSWKGSERYRQTVCVPDIVINEIYNRMNKTTEIQRRVNCKSCGYDSCYQMASAVANGYARMEGCVHYMQGEMEKRYYCDILTGLPNQQGFIKECERFVDTNGNKDLIFIVSDINKLGNINELYSNEAGNIVVREIGKWFQEFAEGRGICARLVGGTFGLCIENDLEAINLLKNMDMFDFKNQGIDYQVSLKSGIVNYDSETDIGIMSYLNKAFYTARLVTDKSKNSIAFYNEELGRSLKNDVVITQRMHKAMSNGEFVVFLQPKYNHSTGKLVGAEALSRWIDQSGKMISPADFVPIFEKNGFIKILDGYVREIVFELLDNWIYEGVEPIPISVNLSRVCLESDDILDDIRKLQRKYERAWKYVQFEVTESAYIANENGLFDKISNIRLMGFPVAMDDFGSGYSSLSVLKDAPIDILKLDMGFMRNEKNPVKGNIIVRNIVGMVNELVLPIVAEGVETKEQADMLCEIGCSIIRGYYYSKPIPISDFEKLL